MNLAASIRGQMQMQLAGAQDSQVVRKQWSDWDAKK